MDTDALERKGQRNTDHAPRTTGYKREKAGLDEEEDEDEKEEKSKSLVERILEGRERGE